jgi:hypothetical protein
MAELCVIWCFCGDCLGQIFVSLHLNKLIYRYTVYRETQYFCNHVINTTNLIHTRFTFNYTLLRFEALTCFGHYLPIFRRHYTNAGLVTVVCGSRWGFVSGCVTGHNTPIHNILSTASQLSISQKALGMLPEDGNVMPKQVGATVYN